MSNSHDRFDEIHAIAQKLQILGLMGRTKHIGIRAICLLRAHSVGQLERCEVLTHFRTTTECVHELLIEPWLVDLQVRVRQDAITIETLDVISLVGAAIAEDVNAVFAHRANDGSGGHGPANRRGIEVLLAATAEMEGAALNGYQSLPRHGFPTVDQPCLDGAVSFGHRDDGCRIVLIGLSEICGITVDLDTLPREPSDSAPRVESTRKCDAHLGSRGGQTAINTTHGERAIRGPTRPSKARIPPCLMVPSQPMRSHKLPDPAVVTFCFFGFALCCSCASGHKNSAAPQESTTASSSPRAGQSEEAVSPSAEETSTGASAADADLQPPAANEELSEAEAEALAAIEATEPDDRDEAQAKREIIYRLSPEGLHVEVEGADFEPSVEAIRVEEGWGIELSVEATAQSDLVLASPPAGPLAFGGKVQRRSGKIESFGDTRESGEDVSLGPESPRSFSKKWPIAGVAPLAVGEELELQVGLWGLGRSGEDQRPVRKFVVVKMRADSHGAQPILEPPR